MNSYLWVVSSQIYNKQPQHGRRNAVCIHFCINEQFIFREVSVLMYKRSSHIHIHNRGAGRFAVRGTQGVCIFAVPAYQLGFCFHSTDLYRFILQTTIDSPMLHLKKTHYDKHGSSFFCQHSHCNPSNKGRRKCLPHATTTERGNMIFVFLILAILSILNA